MSLLGKKWIIKNSDDTLNVIAKLLKNRGIDSPEKADAFLNGDLKDQHPANLLMDLGKAVERIKTAVENHEKIMVFGDYDVDGITATALLYGFLKKVGGDVRYTLPNREDDGYGLKDYFIEQFKKEGTRLIVTVDCGTANLKEIELANKLNMDVVVTDHHTIPMVLPPALALVNPHRKDCLYPNKDICGSSIAYKLIAELAEVFMGKEEARAYLQQQMGLVALGVVGDCMPILGENRILVKEGLKSLIAGHHPGIAALLEEAGIEPRKVNSGTIAFQLTPRINAAGRMDIPNHAFELLIGKLEKAVTLNELNEQRKTMARKHMEEATVQVETMENRPNILLVKDKGWRAGLLGLIASDLVERYGRPAIVMQEREKVFVASMRSIAGFDITGALRREATPLFSAFGGHAMAGGFTLPKENLEKFASIVDRIASTQVNPKEFGGALEIDCEIKPDEITLETAGKLRKLEPYGSENPEPKLLLRNIRILDLRKVGKTGEHLQIPIESGGKIFKGIAFRFGHHADKIDPKKSYDVVVSIEENEWNGNKSVQLRVVDLKRSAE